MVRSDMRRAAVLEKCQLQPGRRFLSVGADFMMTVNDKGKRFADLCLLVVCCRRNWDAIYRTFLTNLPERSAIGIARRVLPTPVPQRSMGADPRVRTRRTGAAAVSRSDTKSRTANHMIRKMI